MNESIFAQYNIRQHNLVLRILFANLYLNSMFLILLKRIYVEPKIIPHAILYRVI